MGILHKVTYLVSEPRLWDWFLTPFCTASQGYLFFFFFSPKDITSFIFLFLAMLGLSCFQWAFCICNKQGLLFIVMYRLLIEVASLVQSTGSRAHRLQQLQPLAFRTQTQYLWYTGLVALLHVEIFPNKESNPCPLHWQADSYQLWHEGSPLFFGF